VRKQAEFGGAKLAELISFSAANACSLIIVLITIAILIGATIGSALITLAGVSFVFRFLNPARAARTKAAPGRSLATGQKGGYQLRTEEMPLA